ncbi:MAG: DUF2147 domain-containing protein [Bacteroidota bacterium]
MKRIFVLFFFVISYTVFGQSEALGKWITIDDKTGVRKSVVEIYEREGKYFGKVTKMIYRSPEERCTRCEGDLKDRLVLGMDIITGMKFKSRSNNFEGGTILNPESGKTYEGKMWVENGKLIVRGYLFWFYRTQTWEPYKEESDTGE